MSKQVRTAIGCEGTVGGRIMDGSIVVVSGLLTARFDEMIDARPLDLKPSTIEAIIETARRTASAPAT